MGTKSPRNHRNKTQHILFNNFYNQFKLLGQSQVLIKGDTLGHGLHNGLMRPPDLFSL